MKQRYTEVSCDYCESAIVHALVGEDVNKRTRADGGIVTRKGNHFCDKYCKSEFDATGRRRD